MLLSSTPVSASSHLLPRMDGLFRFNLKLRDSCASNWIFIVANYNRCFVVVIGGLNFIFIFLSLHRINIKQRSVIRIRFLYLSFYFSLSLSIFHFFSGFLHAVVWLIFPLFTLLQPSICDYLSGRLIVFLCLYRVVIDRTRESETFFYTRCVYTSD